MEKLILIDGNSLVFRFFFALPLLTNSNGTYTNAIYGFAKTLLKILSEETPTHMLVAFDAGKVTFRNKDFAEYKGGRQKTPGELSEQIPYVLELLEILGISHFQLEGFEADDIIGTIATLDQNKLPTLVISGDRDLLQLVDDKTEMLYVSHKGLAQFTKYSPAVVEDEYSLTPAQIIDLKGLMGDTSDNIPGVPGVGLKTATKLLHQYPSLEQILDNIDSVPGTKLQDKLAVHKEQALLSKRLATICTEVPLPFTLEDLRIPAIDKRKVNDFFRSLEMKSLLLPETTDTNVETEHLPCRLVDSNNLSDFCLFLELQTLAYCISSNTETLVLSDGETQFAVGANSIGWSELTQWLSDPTKSKLVYDLKSTIISLSNLDVRVSGALFDVFLAAHLLDPAEADLKLENIFLTHVDQSMPVDEEYHSEAAYAIFTLYNILHKKIKDVDMLDLLCNLEMPTAEVLAHLELRGVQIARARLEEIGQELSETLKTLTEQVYEMAGGEFNIGSPKQLSAVLFDKLGLTPVKKTKTGYSTNAEVLEKLESQHEIIPQILRYRQVSKLLSTYVEGLAKEIKPDGKIHTQFNQTITATGRLSSSEPNLQNIPIRLEEGRRLRQIFVPSEPDWYILAADYSQIELRVLAHISQDANLVKAFQEGKDIHLQTSMEVFGVPAEEVTSTMRRQAKAINFGIVYGISDFGLSQNLNISRKEAADFIDRYFDTYPGVRKHMDELIRSAQQNGFVKTLLNRRRYIPDINSRDFNRRGFAERVAINMPIQGSAADIIKKAMINIESRLQAEGWQGRMLLQVHDELIFEMPEEEKSAMKELVRFEMENSFSLLVPLCVDISIGDNWYEAK